MLFLKCHLNACIVCCLRDGNSFFEKLILYSFCPSKMLLVKIQYFWAISSYYSIFIPRNLVFLGHSHLLFSQNASYYGKCWRDILLQDCFLIIHAPSSLSKYYNFQSIFLTARCSKHLGCVTVEKVIGQYYKKFGVFLACVQWKLGSMGEKKTCVSGKGNSDFADRKIS